MKYLPSNIAYDLHIRDANDGSIASRSFVHGIRGTDRSGMDSKLGTKVHSVCGMRFVTLGQGVSIWINSINTEMYIQMLGWLWLSILRFD